MTAGALRHAPISAVSLSRGAFIALGASIPISTFVDGVLTVTIVLAWLAAVQWREVADAVRRNPVARIACVWFVVHALGTLYSFAAPDQVWRAIGKSATFLLIPIAVAVLRNDRDVRLAHFGFISAIGLTMLLSYLRWAGLLPPDMPLLKNAGYSASVVFKYHLTQNLLLAYGAFVFAVYARLVTTRNSRLFLAACAVLAATNVLIIGDGRTGQVVLIVLAVYYGSWVGGRKGFVTALAGIFAVAFIAYAVPGSSVHKRAVLAFSDATEWRPGIHDKPSGVKERLEFYRRSLQILQANPLVGVGAGGFAAADRAVAARHGMPPTDHPHNEYLLQAVELGVAGLILLIVMFWVLWRAAGRLAEPAHTALARGLVLMYAFGSFGTSMLNDHAETLLFVWMTAVLFHGLQERSQART
jgi:O-antigen ligase